MRQLDEWDFSRLTVERDSLLKEIHKFQVSASMNEHNTLLLENKIRELHQRIKELETESVTAVKIMKRPKK